MFKNKWKYRYEQIYRHLVFWRNRYEEQAKEYKKLCASDDSQFTHHAECYKKYIGMKREYDELIRTMDECREL